MHALQDEVVTTLQRYVEMMAKYIGRSHQADNVVRQFEGFYGTQSDAAPETAGVDAFEKLPQVGGGIEFLFVNPELQEETTSIG